MNDKIKVSTADDEARSKPTGDAGGHEPSAPPYDENCLFDLMVPNHKHAALPINSTAEKALVGLALILAGAGILHKIGIF